MGRNTCADLRDRWVSSWTMLLESFFSQQAVYFWEMLSQFITIIQFISVSMCQPMIWEFLYRVYHEAIPDSGLLHRSGNNFLPDSSCIKCIYFKMGDRLKFPAPTRFSECFAALRHSPETIENLGEGSAPLQHLATSISLPEMKQVGVVGKVVIWLIWCLCTHGEVAAAIIIIEITTKKCEIWSYLITRMQYIAAGGNTIVIYSDI